MASLLRLIVTALALSSAALAAAEESSGPAGPKPDLRSEQGLRMLLDPLEARYEAACVKLDEARWRDATGTDVATPVATSPLEAARRELATIFADTDLDEALSIWTQRSTITQDPGLSRRVTLWHRTREIAGVELDPPIFSLTQTLAARLRTHRFAWDGRQVTRAQLDRIIATSPDRAARRKAWQAEASFAGEVRADVKKLIRMRAVKAQGTKQRYYHHLIYGGSEIDAYWAYGLMEQLGGKSQGPYRALDDALKAALGQTSAELLEAWDLEYALNKRTSQRGLDKALAAAFPPGGEVAAARRLLEALGFDPNTVPIRAAPVELGFAAALVLPVRIPDDIRIAAETAGAGGPRSYEAVFRAYGRALQGAFNKQSAPMLKGYGSIPGARNEVYAESMAGALGEFVRDPVFLEKYLGMDRKSIDLFLEDEADRALVRLRDLLLNMGIEFAFYVNPDADLDERYRVLLGRSLGVEATASTPITWAARIAFVTDPGIDLDRIIALSVAPEAHARLKEAFGDGRLGSGKSAPWLIEHCYAGGELVELQMRLSDSIHGGMDFDKVLERLVGAPTPADRH